MSNLERSPQETPCGGRVAVAAEPVRELQFGHRVALGGPRGMTVTRSLPNRIRRIVGAWCFVDVYGPEDITGAAGMQVPPHPHTGLQTVSWLVEGQVLHRDSIGSEQLIRPGQLNLMTAGHGIAHSEQSPPDHSPILHGVQLWTALPDHSRAVAPNFEHHPDLPVLDQDGCSVTLIMGELAGQAAPAQVYSPLVGAEARLAAGAQARIPLQPEWEYAALALSGEPEVDGVRLAPGPLLYLGRARSELRLRAELPALLLLFGGAPFEEHLVMWWNFVGRDHDDIVAAREQWMAADPRFGRVRGHPGPALPAPPMPSIRLRPRGRHR